jgi:hypothetical protein
MGNDPVEVIFQLPSPSFPLPFRLVLFVFVSVFSAPTGFTSNLPQLAWV